ncbi:hypothetical protein GVAV_001561 [Gurleya vavrai]
MKCEHKTISEKIKKDNPIKTTKKKLLNNLTDDNKAFKLNRKGRKIENECEKTITNEIKEQHEEKIQENKENMNQNFKKSIHNYLHNKDEAENIKKYTKNENEILNQDTLSEKQIGNINETKETKLEYTRGCKSLDSIFNNDTTTENLKVTKSEKIIPRELEHNNILESNKTTKVINKKVQTKQLSNFDPEKVECNNKDQFENIKEINKNKNDIHTKVDDADKTKENQIIKHFPVNNLKNIVKINTDKKNDAGVLIPNEDVADIRCGGIVEVQEERNERNIFDEEIKKYNFIDRGIKRRKLYYCKSCNLKF